MGDRPVLVLRGEVLPLVRLADAIGMERLFENPETGCLEPDKRAKIEDRRSPGAEAARKAAGGKDRAKERGQEDRRFHSASDFRIIVVRASGFRYGVIVDRLYDTTEIVVKPLGRHLKALKEYSGATILGDGAVALIIDPAGLALKAGLTTAGEDRVVAEEKVVDDARGWLLFRNGAVEQCAVPLESVERVVKLRQDDLDAIGEDLFLRLGELSLPVFSVSSFTGLTKLGPERAEACVLCHVAGLRFGFLASPPVDSVSADTALDTRSMRRAGVAGTAVIQGRTTVVIDPAGALAALRPQWFDAAAEGQTRATTPKSRPPGAGQSGSRPLVVVAEDSDFFRHLISEILTDSGYEVRETRDGQEALELIHELAGEVRLVLTDVEMPRLDGQGLCVKLKTEYPDLPVVALSSLASEVDEKALRAAGASDYLVKLDRDALLASVASLMDRVGDERLEKETR